MIVKAFAKMNLALKVNGVLENGYHDLEMLNTRINLFDKIVIKKSKKDSFIMKPEICSTEQNIAYKAYIKLKEKFNTNNCYNIVIKKSIPSGAGLGGGSADAAAIINAIIKLEKINFNEQELNNFALSIGADVPYCLYGDKCIVRGVGENISKIDLKNEWNVILISPGVNVSTKQVFENFNQNDSTLNFKPIIENLNNVESHLFNDLEISSKKAYSDYKLDEIKENLKNNKALTSLMTGSGSTVFGLFDIKNKRDWNNCYKNLIKIYPNYKIRKCKTISY